MRCHARFEAAAPGIDGLFAPRLSRLRRMRCEPAFAAL
jgi:hypothetical protein